MRTTSGAPELAEHVPAVDAVAVRRLRDAGAVVVGKTNTPMYASDLQTYNELFGQTNNPWDLTRTPGGSSGGAAAAVAAGIVPLELGSDLGGSIRMPAHCCGVYGLKPTWGIVPMRGHIPGAPGSLVEADVVSGGPLARSVEDLRLGLEVTAGPLPEDAVGWRLALPDAAVPVDLGDLRLAVTLDDPAFPVAAEVRAVLGAFVDAVTDAGASVVEVPTPVPMVEGMDCWYDLVYPMVGVGLPEALYDAFSGAERVDGDPASAAFARFTASFRDRARATQRRQEQRRRWAAHLAHFDAHVLPALPVPAFVHDNQRPPPERSVDVDGRAVTGFDLGAWPSAVGAMLLPAVVIPAGATSSGLPVGVQLVGRHLGDLPLLGLAAALDAVGPGFRRPPGY
jgi:amidase